MQLPFVSRKKYDELRVKYYDALETVQRRKAECERYVQQIEMAESILSRWRESAHEQSQAVAELQKERDAIRQDLCATRGSVECASRSTAELIGRLNWNADRVLEFEKSMQFGD